MAHVIKCKRSAIGHLAQHYERGKDEHGEYIKYSNQSINTELSHLNYNLVLYQKLNQVEFIRKRCSEVQCMNRNDVNVMCTWVVTAPKDLLQSDEEKFFRETCGFLENRYGKENVISAYVHNDETTPHMHFSFVPVTIDKKKGIEKVSAKEILNKTELKKFHPDLEIHLAKVFGRELGILNDATRDGNKSVEELKRKSAVERLKEAEREAEETISAGKKFVTNNINKAQENLKTTEQKCAKMISTAQGKVDALRDKQKVLEGQIKSCKCTLSSFYDIDRIGKKSVLGGKVTMTEVEAEKLKEQAKAYYAEKNRADKAISESNRVSERAGRVSPLEAKVRELRRDLADKETEIKGMKKVLLSDPQLVKLYNNQITILEKERERQEEQQRREWEQEEQKQEKSWGMEM